MVQPDSFEMTLATPRFTFTIKSQENSPSLEASPGTNNLLATTHQYHPHLPYTFQWDINLDQ